MILREHVHIFCGQLYGYGKDAKLYILPNPVNDRLTTDQLIQKVKSLSSASSHDKYYSRVYVEDVGFQGVITDLLKAEGVPTQSFFLRGRSKEDRLMAVSSLIELGKVVFPRKGAESLINQILGFGVEKHDDLVDACTMLILQAFEESKRPVPRISWIDRRELFGR